MVTVLAPVAVCVYAFPSTVINAVPLLVDLPYGGVAVTGVLAGVTLGAGTVVAGLQRRLGAWTAVVGAGAGHDRLRGRRGVRDDRGGAVADRRPPRCWERAAGSVSPRG